MGGVYLPYAKDMLYLVEPAACTLANRISGIFADDMLSVSLDWLDCLNIIWHVKIATLQTN